MLLDGTDATINWPENEANLLQTSPKDLSPSGNLTLGQWDEEQNRELHARSFALHLNFSACDVAVGKRRHIHPHFLAELKSFFERDFCADHCPDFNPHCLAIQNEYLMANKSVGVARISQFLSSRDDG